MGPQLSLFRYLVSCHLQTLVTCQVNCWSVVVSQPPDRQSKRRREVQPLLLYRLLYKGSSWLASRRYFWRCGFETLLQLTSGYTIKFEWATDVYRSSAFKRCYSRFPTNSEWRNWLKDQQPCWNFLDEINFVFYYEEKITLQPTKHTVDMFLFFINIIHKGSKCTNIYTKKYINFNNFVEIMMNFSAIFLNSALIIFPYISNIIFPYQNLLLIRSLIFWFDFIFEF